MQPRLVGPRARLLIPHPSGRRLCANSLVFKGVNGQTSAETSTLYSALLKAFLAHLPQSAKKCLRL
jgi:hypothetical protein